MKLINSRGRTLLEVTSATAFFDNTGTLDRVLYTYTGDGCGGYVDIVGLHRTIEAIKLDAPSAKLIGLLPHPRWGQ